MISGGLEMIPYSVEEMKKRENPYETFIQLSQEKERLEKELQIALRIKKKLEKELKRKKKKNGKKNGLL